MEKKKSNIELSIIIVSYNHFDLLYNCLNSISSKLSAINYEIIVVDNNSTEEGLEEIISKFENVHLIRNSENLGFAKANNQAVKLAKGEYILLLNNDTEILDDSIIKMLEFIKEKPNSIVAPKLLNKDKSYQPSAYKFPSLVRLFFSYFFIEKLFRNFNFFNKYYVGIERKSTVQKVDAVIGAFMLMKKEIYEKLNGFDEEFFFYHEDTDLCYRLKKIGGEVYYFPQYSVIHVGGGTTKNIPWFSLKNRVIARLKFFRKNKLHWQYPIMVVLEKTANFMRTIIYFIFGILTFNKKKLKTAKNYFMAIFLSINSDK